jgi:hypothetical protein
MKKSIVILLALVIGISLLPSPTPTAYSAQPGTPTVTTLLESGGTGEKFDLVIIGDGFQTGNDQTVFNNYVQNEIINGVFGEGPLWESMNAFNIYRINTVSQDSGVTQVNGAGTVTTQRNTALDYRFSADWNRCWMEYGPNTAGNLNTILNTLVPQRDYVFVVLNEPGFGGCQGGNQLAITRGANWTVGAHEMGHMVGRLCDEYVGGANPTTFAGDEPDCVNLTTNINRNTLRWREFVDPNTPLATTFNPATMNASGTTGAFVGGTLGQSGFNAGIWRPSSQSRMNNNTPPFNSVGYTRMKNVMDPFHEYTYDKSYVGDFNGDSLADVVIHNDNSLALYLSNGSHLVPTWIATGRIPVWDLFMPNDQFLVGDFDGDGLDDLYVYNFTDWAFPYFGMLRSNGNGFEALLFYESELPGWGDMRPSDTFYVGDFDGDNLDDVFVFNGHDWAVGYLGMLRSTGSGLTMARRYDDTLPGWGAMKGNDQFYVANIDRDALDDLYIFNGWDWSMGYLHLLQSQGNSLQYLIRYDGKLPGWDDMRPHDQFYVANFDGDSDEDLYVFNGVDWSIAYLEKLVSRGNQIVAGTRWDGNVPGWDDLLPNDQFFVADINGDGQEDLYAYNALDWNTQYLGALISNGITDLTGFWQADWIGEWNLSHVDHFLVGNFNGGAGWDDLFIRNNDWFGLLRSQSASVSQISIYPRWIHDLEYHVNNWW